ncbi:MAG: DUF4838 domain-containing protein [Abditibacteriota bacterium]|nr:DUF4838 domain-containing protein [Abditibacteriota bacterium]
MKNVLIILLLIIGISLFAEDINIKPNAKWQNSLKPKGDAITITISKDNKADIVIIKPFNATSQEEKASSDLSFFLSKMTGVEIPLIKDSEYKEGKYISVGNTSFFRQSEYSKISDKLESEGLAIHGDENCLYLFGGKRRGPLYAVYTFLEEDNGFRFWTKDRAEDYIPISNVISFVPRYYNPPFEIRDPWVVQSQDTSFVLLNKLNAHNLIAKEYGGSYESYGGLAHTCFIYADPNVLFNEHPEWFSMRDGQRGSGQICWSNEEVLKYIANRVIELKKENDFECFNISPNDGIPLCDCPECSKLDNEEGTKAASMIKGLNYICDIVNKEYPDLKIMTLAYLDYKKAPKTIRPNKNIIIRVCADEHDWPYPLCTYNETEEFRQNLEDWTKIGGNVYAYTYIVNFSNYIIPDPNLLLTAKNNKIIQSIGGTGIFMQGNWERNTVMDSGRMKVWIWSKLLWNPDLDPEALMKDFVYGYYGEAAEPIYQYEKSLISIWKKHHGRKHVMKPYDEGGIRWMPDSKLYTDTWTNNSMKLMDNAIKLTDSDNMKDRVEHERISVVYLKLCRDLGYINGEYPNVKRTLKKKLSDKEKEYYLSLINEVEEFYKKIDCTTLAETNPRDNVILCINLWKEILEFDPYNYKTSKIDSDNWKFCFDKDNEGMKSGFFKPDFNIDNWQTVSIEKFWSEYKGGGEEYKGNAWYKKTLNISEDLLNNNSLYLYFKSIDEEATVYINGELAYSHTVEATGKQTNILWNEPFYFDIKPLIHVGNNDITVMVGNPTGLAGGIYKEIYYLYSNEDLDKTSKETISLIFAE